MSAGWFMSRRPLGACVWPIVAGRFAAPAVCAVVGALLFACSVAAAAPVALSEFPVTDGLVGPQALTVDRASGNVYAIDLPQESVGESVARFDASGNPVAFTAPSSYALANELVGTPSEAFALFNGPSAAQVAVDDSGGPLNGDVYVTDSMHRFVDVFAASGEYLGRLNGLGTPQFSFGEPCGVAVDSSGRVYVGDAGGYIERYTPSAKPSFPVGDSDYQVSELSGTGGTCAIAVNAAGDVFANAKSGGTLREYEHTQFPASGSAPGAPSTVSESSYAVAVDPASGWVYVDEGTQVSVYETPAKEAAKLIESFGSLSGNSYGVAVGSGGTVYVSDLGEEDVHPVVYVFGPPTPSAPAVVSESSANVSADGAELKAQINPDFTDTHYRFQYGTTTAYGGEVPLTPVDIGAAGGVTGVQSVSEHVRGLLASSTYHYRAVAEYSSGGEVVIVPGADATFTTPPAGVASVLPDGRAWEMVTPVNKGDVFVTGIDGLPGGTNGGLIQSDPKGDALVYASNGTFAQSASGALASQYLATRGEGGWSSQSLMPSTPIYAESYGVLGRGGPYKFFSEDLSTGLMTNGLQRPIRNAPLSEEAPAGYQNYYVHDDRTGEFKPVLTKTQTPGESAAEFELEFQGASADMSQMVFASPAALTAHATQGSVGNDNLYEWNGNGLELINILPKQEGSTPGAVLEGGQQHAINPVSNDGTKVFFKDNVSLYAYVRGLGTIQLDAAQGGPGAGGEGLLQAASSDGSKVFFLDRQRLTNGSTSNNVSGIRDLYEYNFEKEKEPLSDLTTRDPAGADVQSVVGLSSDGSYVYFVANGVLAPGASKGHCYGSKSEAFRRCNLYVWHRGAPEPIKFIATLSGDDNSELTASHPEFFEAANDWTGLPAERTVRVAPDGKRLVFMSDGDLTGYDSRNATTGAPEEEVYVYDAESGVLSCASCRPSGARPTGHSSVVTGTQYESGRADYLSRVVFDGGGGTRVFFDSTDAVVPQDVNGQRDVYEWEENVGSCRQPGGCVSLISSGTSSGESTFADASADGRDVFFLTYSQLVPQDTDELLDVYDAREGGGFASPPTVSSACNGEDCKLASAPTPASVLEAPASVSVVRVGNALAPSAAPTVKHRKPTVKHKHRRARPGRGRHRHGRGARARVGRSRGGRR